MSTTTVLQLLHTVTAIRERLGCDSRSQNSALTSFTCKETFVPPSEQVDTITPNNTPITDAVARYKPVFQSHTLSEVTRQFIQQSIAQDYGAPEDNYIIGYVNERTETDTHHYHARDLRLLKLLLQPVIQNRFAKIHAEYGIVLDAVQESAQMDTFSSMPDHRIIVQFTEISKMLRAYGEKAVMQVITLEDKPLKKMGEGMFLETTDSVLKWPTKDMKKFENPSFKENKSRRLAVQMATQMHDFSVKYGIFYTINRTIYVKKEGKKLIRSHVKLTGGAKEIKIDFVEYASWVMAALDDALDNFNLWYSIHVVPKLPKQSSSSSSSQPVARFALTPSISLPSSIFGSPLALFSRVQVQIGKKYCQEFDRAPKIAGCLPKSFCRLFFPEVKIDCPIDLWSSSGNKVVGINPALGIVAKITTRSSEVFHHEAHMTCRASKILPKNTPTVFAVYNTYPQMILLSYTGTSFTDWAELGKDLLQELLDLIGKLHFAHFHHHDIRPENITVDSRGRVSIIDFETSVHVVGRCEDCPDESAVEEIVEIIDDLDGQDGDEEQWESDQNTTSLARFLERDQQLGAVSPT